MTTLIDQIDSELVEFTDLRRVIEQRRNLSVIDGSAVDQMQTGLAQLWMATGMKDHELARQGLRGMMTMKLLEQRCKSLLDSGYIEADCAAAVDHILQEVRMALTGFLN